MAIIHNQQEYYQNELWHDEAMRRTQNYLYEDNGLDEADLETYINDIVMLNSEVLLEKIKQIHVPGTTQDRKHEYLSELGAYIDSKLQEKIFTQINNDEYDDWKQKEDDLNRRADFANTRPEYLK